MEIANYKLQIAKEKMLHFLFYILPLVFLVSGCAAFQVGGDIQRGRKALLYGDPKVALAHFQRAAELDPDYVNKSSPLRVGVWTYIGRANYTSGNLAEASKALERARSRHEDDQLAKLYLGLVLARNGDRDRGLREIETGLKGLTGWFDYIEQYHPDGRFWDPGRPIRKEIQKNLAMISGKEFSWPELISSWEWLGRTLEEEIDKARKDEMEERKQHQDGDSQND